MRQRHAALAAAFDETPPAWAVVAAQMADHGITDADGKPPTAMGARQTWYRVRRDVAARAAKLAPTTPPLAPLEIAPGVHSVGRQPDLPAPRPVPEFDIRPARPRDVAHPDPGLGLPVNAAPDLTAPALAAGASQDGVNDQMRRVSEAMDTGKTPMPTVTR
jgi:hypothetical protein